MHELSLCHSLIQQVESIARREQAQRVVAITLRVGPLSGVESELLVDAFPFAAAGTVAEGAALRIEAQPVRVHCSRCQLESDAVPNRLLCGACGDYRTRLVSGDELLLASLELEQAGDQRVGRE